MPRQSLHFAALEACDRYDFLRLYVCPTILDQLCTVATFFNLSSALGVLEIRTILSWKGTLATVLGPLWLPLHICTCSLQTWRKSAFPTSRAAPFVLADRNPPTVAIPLNGSIVIKKNVFSPCLALSTHLLPGARSC